MYSRPITLGVAALAATSCVLGATPAEARDRPVLDLPDGRATGARSAETGTSTGGSGQFSNVAIERYRCNVGAGAAYGSPLVPWTSRATTPSPTGRTSTRTTSSPSR